MSRANKARQVSQPVQACKLGLGPVQADCSDIITNLPNITVIRHQGKQTFGTLDFALGPRPGVATLFVGRAEKLPRKTWRIESIEKFKDNQNYKFLSSKIIGTKKWWNS